MQRHPLPEVRRPLPENGGMMAKGRAQTIRNRDGSVTTRHPDGTESTKYKDGSTATKDSEGTFTVHHRDGTESVVYKNGTQQDFDKNGNLLRMDEADGTQTTWNRDGTMTVIKPDETETTVYKDQTQRTTYPDGTVTTSRSDGSETVTSPTGDSKTTYTDGRVVESPADGTHMNTYPDGRSAFISTTGHIVEMDRDDRISRVTEPDGTLWTYSKDGTTTVRLPDGTVRNETPGFEVTNSPGGGMHMSFPGGVELNRSPDGNYEWSSSGPTAMQDVDGFVEDGIAAANVSSSGEELGSASDVIGDIDASLANAAIVDASEDAAATEAGSTATETWNDPVLGSTMDTVAQASGIDLNRSDPDADLRINAGDAVTDDSMLEQPSPQDQFVAEAPAVGDAAGGMGDDDFDASTITVPTEMTTDEEFA